MFDLRTIKPIHMWVLLILVGLVACTETSPNFGKYYRGKTLDVNIVKLERLPELLYSTVTESSDRNYFRIMPSEDNLELIILRVKVENHTATNAVVNIDERSAELRDFVQGKYFPINVNETMIEVGEPENPYDERSMVFLWNKLLPSGEGRAVELRRGCGLEGWLLFEAPIDTKFREFKWVAGDSLTIDF